LRLPKRSVGILFVDPAYVGRRGIGQPCMLLAAPGMFFFIGKLATNHWQHVFDCEQDPQSAHHLDKVGTCNAKLQ